jgi:hypothetical protein
MSRRSQLLAALTDEPTSTEQLYDRVGYATLARLGLIPYDAFRAALTGLVAEGLAESTSTPAGATLWQLPAPESGQQPS